VARVVLDSVATGSLATLTVDGAPFASLVLTATDEAGDVILLLSRLAAHTRNLECDPRASLLAIAAGGETGDPLAGARVTVLGRAERGTSDEARRKFLDHHPEAAAYVSFADFGFWCLKIESAHLVAGFGRIVDLSREALQKEPR
jgi:putative heme iron utilization protein